MKLIKQKIWRENPENILLDFLENQTSVSIMDVLGRIIYANEKFCELIEIPRNSVIGELNSILKSEIHANPTYKELWATIKSGQIWKGILSDYSSSKKLYRVETTIIPGRNSNGEIDKYVALFVEIEQNFDANLNIVDHNIVSKPLLDSASKLIFKINAFAEIQSANQGYGQLNEFDIVGSSLYSFVNPIFHDTVKSVVKDVFNSGKPNQYETIGINALGEHAFYLSHISPVLNHKGVVVSATIFTQEVKEIGSIKRELIENENKYRAIFQSMKVGIIVVADEQGKITEWNKGAERAFGYSSHEMIGENLTKLMADKNRNKNIVELLNAVKNLEDFKSGDTVELIGMKKNGSVFPLEFALSKWRNGDSIFYCAMMLDVSNRKILENRLKRKSKDLQLFLYRSAHDLRAPLASAEGLVNLIKEEEGVSDSVLGLISMLETALNSGKKLIENLTFASDVSGKCKEIVLIDFSKIIKNVIWSSQGLDNFNEIKFRIDVDDSIEYFSSEDLMNSLFQNLIQNAIKYSAINNSQQAPMVTIKVSASNNKVVICVQDNGIGILKKNISKIFNLYYRENIENTPGSGLGLYIVKNIVDDLNGKIEVTSKVNEGTYFTIKLQNKKRIKTA
jgi:PAS domain S-box-containing protein